VLNSLFMLDYEKMFKAIYETIFNKISAMVF